MTNYKVLEVSDAKHYCMCCGRTGLKRVVFIENLLSGEISHFGTTCATQPQNGFGVDKEIKEAIKDHQHKESVINTITHHTYRKLGGKYTTRSDGSGFATDKTLFDTTRKTVKGSYGSY